MVREINLKIADSRKKVRGWTFRKNEALFKAECPDIYDLSWKYQSYECRYQDSNRKCLETSRSSCKSPGFVG